MNEDIDVWSRRKRDDFWLVGEEAFYTRKQLAYFEEHRAQIWTRIMALATKIMVIKANLPEFPQLLPSINESIRVDVFNDVIELMHSSTSLERFTRELVTPRKADELLSTLEWAELKLREFTNEKRSQRKETTLLREAILSGLGKLTELEVVALKAFHRSDVSDIGKISVADIDEGLYGELKIALAAIQDKSA